MAPKKQHQQHRKKDASRGRAQFSDTKYSPKLQISAESERRLRRLLLNSGELPVTSINSSEALSKSQKAKKLRSIYEKLSCEGFTDDQIERAISALNEGATFESTLDWLCLNLVGNELPLKFSSGTSLSSSEDKGGSITIISTAQENWVPSQVQSIVDKDKMKEVSLRVKRQVQEISMESEHSSQVEWIKKYVQHQQEKEEWESLLEEGEARENGAHSEEVMDPSTRVVSIVKDYHAARQDAIAAKKSGNKKSQESAGLIIRQLKQELSSLGLSDKILETSLEDEHNSTCILEDVIHDDSDVYQFSEEKGSDSAGGIAEEAFFNMDVVESGIVVEETRITDEDTEDASLTSLFSDKALQSGYLSPEGSIEVRENLVKVNALPFTIKIDDFWRKGDQRKLPKAVLHQLCQRLGWEAPKYNKLSEKERNYVYSVNILRSASGRGKNRKPGGLITLQLPDQYDGCDSAEDAQNKVAAFAIYCFCPNLPVHELITEPYSSFVKRWQKGDFATKVENSLEMRRSTFVDSLIKGEQSGSSLLVNTSNVFQEDPSRKESESHLSLKKYEGSNYHKELQSTILKKELDSRKKLPKYKELLEARASLPITEIKDDLLGLLKKHDVIVVCGETGCGKSTQVPQYILDEMIDANQSGFSNIICTQPRRIAAISIAERVAYERCEPLPGLVGSSVGYQVRLDSARNEMTKLLFCTTGILLRKLSGDKHLTGVTHIIVDEVHERSLLGDFLLIILKNLIEKQVALESRKLKVILMSATVDAILFSKYFGYCPILTAKGRTHPISTYFLEDIYEKLNYCLPSDSPATLTSLEPTKLKLGKKSVQNSRGRKNLLLSWGDESLLSEDNINPFYESSIYASYSVQTRHNLKRLNEDAIDYDLLEDLICHIDETYPQGALLIFLPGVAEIHLLLDKLSASYRFRGPNLDWLLPLHSSLATSEQRKVFLSPPEDIRKIVVATNIAETSLTIDDVVYVIDCGKHKESRYNPQKKMSSMVEDWISKANARQRHGRAGRVKPGVCFSMYTRYRFEHLMRPFQAPEMIRTPLVELCLQIKLLCLGDIKSFLLKAIEPPKEEAIVSAISTLYEVGAMEHEEELTPLGCHLAKLPVDVLIGKMMIYGGIFGCLSPILSIAACLSHRSPFLYPKDEKHNVERAKSILLEDNVEHRNDAEHYNRESDHLLMAIAYDKWAKIYRENGQNAAEKFCKSYFLSSSVMYMIRDLRVQFGGLLADIGVITLPKVLLVDGKMKSKLEGWLADRSQPFNAFSNMSSIVKSILCAGLYPNVASMVECIADSAQVYSKRINPNSTDANPVWFDGRREVHIHPSSINNKLKLPRFPFLVFLEKVETSKVFLRDTTVVSPYSLLLFGGAIDIQYQTGRVIVDGWLKLQAPAQTAVLFKELRLRMDSVLKKLVQKPEMHVAAENEVIRSIIHLLLEENKSPH